MNITIFNNMTWITRWQLCTSNGYQLKDMGQVMVGLTKLQKSTQTVWLFTTTLITWSWNGGPWWHVDSFWWGMSTSGTQICSNRLVSTLSTVVMFGFVEGNTAVLVPFLVSSLRRLSTQASFSHMSNVIVNWWSSTWNKLEVSIVFALLLWM